MGAVLFDSPNLKTTRFRQASEFPMVTPRRKSKLLGVGLDGEPDEVRVTRGENFHLVGGSKETHETMQEKSIKFNEKLSARGKSMDDLEKQEFIDLASECGMNLIPSTPRPPKK